MGEEDRAFLRVCRGGGPVWACLKEGHMPASRRSAVGFALACVPTRLPVWLGYKHPQSTGGGQRVQVQLAGAGLWPRSGAVCGPRVSWCLRLCLLGAVGGNAQRRRAVCPQGAVLHVCWEEARVCYQDDPVCPCVLCLGHHVGVLCSVSPHTQALLCVRAEFCEAEEGWSSVSVHLAQCRQG